MPGEGLTPEAALPGCPHEPRAHICRACYAAALLAAEARGREAAAQEVDGCCNRCAERIRALAPAAPKAAPPADARDALREAREELEPLRGMLTALLMRHDQTRLGTIRPDLVYASERAAAVAATLTRSAPPAPAAPVCSAEEK